jgi:hypothetical protein
VGVGNGSCGGRGSSSGGSSSGGDSSCGGGDGKEVEVRVVTPPGFGGGVVLAVVWAGGARSNWVECPFRRRTSSSAVIG